MAERDWGSETFERFRYQAEVTLPYCLSAMLGRHDIVAVIPEHHEDIALQTRSGWRFIQVKSRNPERGLWTASELLSNRGGALRSLYRTYLLTSGDDHPLELMLEGAVKTNDVIGTLRPHQDRSALVPLVMEKLDVCRASAVDFLRRVTLNESAPYRSTIRDTNARLLHEHAKSLTLPELKDLHNSLLAEIEKAMRCEPLGPLWPRSVAHPEKRSTTTEERLRAKTLDAGRLSRFVERLSAEGHPLLKRFVESGSRPVSALAQKLALGDATPDLIWQARDLEANALHQRMVRASQKLVADDSLLTDLHLRLLSQARPAAAIHASSPRPAAMIWSLLLDKFYEHAGNIDRHNIVRADPMLLMGECCILSDECQFNWGGTFDVAE